MGKFNYFRFLASFLLAVTVASAFAIPARNIDPISEAKEVSGAHSFPQPPIVPRANLNDEVERATSTDAYIYPRQIHNADYGSGAGPTSPPQAPPPENSAAADDGSQHDAAAAAAAKPATDNSKAQQRRGFPDMSPHDVDYSYHSAG